MSDVKVAVAQIPSLKGDISVNIIRHLLAIEKAAELGVKYIVFPELSLTSYEPELALELSFKVDDPRLQPLIDAAITHNIHVVVGVPLIELDDVYIASVTISDLGIITYYRKMHLHEGENTYFTAGKKHQLLNVYGFRIANAICADTNHVIHPQQCYELGADIYMAGVLIGESGYQPDTALLKAYSKDFGLLVAVANHNAPTGKWLPIGKSAIWYNNQLIASANETQNALVIAEKQTVGWSGYVVELQ